MQNPGAGRQTGQVQASQVTCQFIKNQTSCQDKCHNITVTCNDDSPWFQSSFRHYLKIKSFEVKSLFPGEKVSKKEAIALSAIVANGLQCPCRPLSIALAKQYFKAGSLPALSGYGHKPFHAMRLRCEAAGYIKVTAERSFNTDTHPISTIQSTQLLIDSVSSNAAIVYKPDFFYLMKGKNKDKRQALTQTCSDDSPTFKISHRHKSSRDYIPISNPNHPRLKHIRTIMNGYYSMITSHRLSCDVPRRVVDLVHKKHLEANKKGDLPLPPDTRFKYPIITFTDDIFTGGRMYGGFWIGCKREYRKFTRIDGQQCVEVDFSAMHPQLLYDLEGLPPQENIYLYPKTEPPITGQINRRTIAKSLMLSMINIDPSPTLPATRRDVINATMGDLEKKHGIKLEYQIIKPVLKSLELRHKPIANHFYSGAWRYCMTKEADIIREIVRVSIEHDILVLPVHDALICQVKKLPEILSIIRSISGMPFDTKMYE